MCYVLRFIHNVKNIERLAGHLAIKELQRAKKYLVQLVQQGEFVEEVKNLRKGATVPSNSKVCKKEGGKMTKYLLTLTKTKSTRGSNSRRNGGRKILYRYATDTMGRNV
ncbi:hypothetical protein AVEN_134137-1 [Araneus ventricosus]|uniref:Uncharacterized protein n=1 Tax=Araneus ventricosus TaxID=182803 RepID=A0A4Y2JG02_ARAVE|nr:hypothetical protein AVEN_134137-1 [Araneus ventricosus]